MDGRRGEFGDSNRDVIGWVTRRSGRCKEKKLCMFRDCEESDRCGGSGNKLCWRLGSGDDGEVLGFGDEVAAVIDCSSALYAGFAGGDGSSATAFCSLPFPPSTWTTFSVVALVAVAVAGTFGGLVELKYLPPRPGLEEKKEYERREARRETLEVCWNIRVSVEDIYDLMSTRPMDEVYEETMQEGAVVLVQVALSPALTDAIPQAPPQCFHLRVSDFTGFISTASS